MKTSEFIKRAKEYAFVKEENGVIILHKGGFTVGEVSTCYHNDYKITWIAINEEENLIREYAKTPLEEREEPKRYYLRPKGMITLGGASFSYNPYGEYWYLENDPSTDHMTTFTIKELEDLGIDIEHYDLEEVE